MSITFPQLPAEEEFNRIQERLRTNKQILLELTAVEITATGVELAKIRVESARVQRQIEDDERLLDAMQIEIADGAGMTTDVVLDRKPFEPETILIPAGMFIMGSAAGEGIDAAEAPPHPLFLPAFRIGRYPVTNREYAAFIRDKAQQPAPGDWFNRQPPAERLEHPVTEVSWQHALAYCAWLSKQTGRRYTLPSEAEWEKAAAWGRDDKVTGRQGDKVKRVYPWGNEWEEGRCNAGGSGTTPVTAHPAGASAYGVEDLLGNVQQWTRSLWGGQVQQPDFAYPYQPDDGREVLDPRKLPAQMRIVHRGGYFGSEAAELRNSARGSASPERPISWRGFRVVMV